MTIPAKPTKSSTSIKSFIFLVLTLLLTGISFLIFSSSSSSSIVTSPTSELSLHDDEASKRKQFLPEILITEDTNKVSLDRINSQVDAESQQPEHFLLTSNPSLSFYSDSELFSQEEIELMARQQYQTGRLKTEKRTTTTKKKKKKKKRTPNEDEQLTKNIEEIVKTKLIGDFSPLKGEDDDENGKKNKKVGDYASHAQVQKQNQQQEQQQKNSFVVTPREMLLVPSIENFRVVSRQLGNIMNCSKEFSKGFYWNLTTSDCQQLDGWIPSASLSPSSSSSSSVSEEAKRKSFFVAAKKTYLEPFEVSVSELSCPALQSSWKNISSGSLSADDRRLTSSFSSYSSSTSSGSSSGSSSIAIPPSILARYHKFIAASIPTSKWLLFRQWKPWSPFSPVATIDVDDKKINGNSNNENNNNNNNHNHNNFLFTSYHDPKMKNLFRMENFCLDPSSSLFPLRGYFGKLQSDSATSSGGETKTTKLNHKYQGKDDTRNLFHGDFGFRRFLSNVAQRSSPPLFFEQGRPVFFVPLTKISMGNLGHLSLKILSAIGNWREFVKHAKKGTVSSPLVVFVIDDDHDHNHDADSRQEIKQAWGMFFQMLDLPWALIKHKNGAYFSPAGTVPPSSSSSLSSSSSELCFRHGFAYQNCYDCAPSRTKNDINEPYSFRIFDRLTPERRKLMDLQVDLYRSKCGMQSAAANEDDDDGKNHRELPKIFFDLRTGSRGIKRLSTMIDQIRQELMIHRKLVRDIVFLEPWKTSRYRYLQHLQDSDIFFGVHGGTFAQTWVMMKKKTTTRTMMMTTKHENNLSSSSRSQQIRRASPILIELSEKYYEQHCATSSDSPEQQKKVSCWFGIFSEYLDADHWVLRVPNKKHGTKWDGKNSFSLSIRAIVNILREGICRWNLKRSKMVKMHNSLHEENKQEQQLHRRHEEDDLDHSKFAGESPSSKNTMNVDDVEILEEFKKNPNFSDELKNFCALPSSASSSPSLMRRKTFSGLVPSPPTDFALLTSPHPQRTEKLSSAATTTTAAKIKRSNIFGGSASIENAFTTMSVSEKSSSSLSLQFRQENPSHHHPQSRNRQRRQLLLLLSEFVISKLATRLSAIRQILELIIGDNADEDDDDGDNSSRQHKIRLISAQPGLWQPFVDFFVNNVEGKKNKNAVLSVQAVQTADGGDGQRRRSLKILCVVQRPKQVNEVSLQLNDEDCLFLEY